MFFYSPLQEWSIVLFLIIWINKIPSNFTIILTTGKPGGLGTSAFSFNTGNASNTNNTTGLFGGAASNQANQGNLTLPSQNQQQSNDLLQALIMSPFGDSPLFQNKINDEDRIKQVCWLFIWIQCLFTYPDILGKITCYSKAVVFKTINRRFYSDSFKDLH